MDLGLSTSPNEINNPTMYMIKRNDANTDMAEIIRNFLKNNGF